MNETADSRLFAEGPVRDDRFVVVERWGEMVNLPASNPLRRREFFHRQMNEEVDSLECSARHIADFPDAEWALRMCLARQCADESRHARMFRRALESRGGRVGEFPVLNFQYRIITKIDNLVGRLAVQNRSFEAGGLDAIAFEIQHNRTEGDVELAELFEAQMADEITHVRFANEWINLYKKKNPRMVLQMGTALTRASEAFHAVMGHEGTEGALYPADAEGRMEAGFERSEVDQAVAIAASIRSEERSGSVG
jgi:rubrerythrin